MGRTGDGHVSEFATPLHTGGASLATKAERSIVGGAIISSNVVYDWLQQVVSNRK